MSINLPLNNIDYSCPSSDIKEEEQNSSFSFHFHVDVTIAVCFSNKKEANGKLIDLFRINNDIHFNIHHGSCWGWYRLID